MGAGNCTKQKILFDVLYQGRAGANADREADEDVFGMKGLVPALL
jgi:hypothetical protein